MIYLCGYFVIGFILASIAVKYEWINGDAFEFSAVFLVWPIGILLILVLSALNIIEMYVNFLKKEK